MNYLPLICVYILSAALTVASLVMSVRSARQRQEQAYAGDAAAAKRILLPCFKPLFVGLIIFFSLIVVVLCFTAPFVLIWVQDFIIIQYVNFCMIVVHAITPVLLVQSSISYHAFWTAFYIITPWWALSTLFWGLSFIGGSTTFPMLVIFLLLSAVPPIVLSVLILGRFIKSRVQLGSLSNRNSIEFMLLYATVYLLTFGVVLFGRYGEQAQYIVSLVITPFSVVLGQLFPFILYRTLLADTKFWRGLGRHNQGGINTDDSCDTVSRPTMELSIASTTFQDMMSDVGKISIDFAYLQLRKIIGHGASSEVYVGRYKSREVAIKVSNPPEITEEQIDGFVAEAKIASSLFHPNVVEFVGICVRPPQIAMVFEFCEGGNLKSSLTSSPHLWTPLRRIDACTDACRAISCMHNLRLIHRDLKAENFFVGAEQVVKLGDFGESTRFRSMESARTKRMTILGTVAFMAPELIAAHKHYTESIDIYALAVTMWEIWTGRDPYEDISQFEIYEKVAQGYRPGLPTDSPPGFNDILVSAWQEDAANRPTAAEMVEQLEELVKGFSEEQLDGLRQSSERPTGSNPLGGGGGDAGGGGAGSAGEGVAESAKAAGVAGVAGVAGAAGGARGAGAVEMQLNPLVSSSEVDDVAHRLSRVPSTHSRTNSTNSSASEKSPKVPPAVP